MASLEAAADAVEGTEALPTQTMPEAVEAPEAQAPQTSKTMARMALVTFLAALAVLGIAIAMILMTPPELAVEQVLSDFDSADILGARLVSPLYASDEPWHLEGERVSSIEDDGTGGKAVRFEVALANPSFSAIVGIDRSYALEDGAWVPGNWRISSVDATPIAPVDEEKVLADISNILAKVPAGEGTPIAQLYEGADFEIVDAVLDGESCKVTISADRTYVLNRFQATVEAGFVFIPGQASSDGGTWKLATASVDEGAQEPQLAPIVGPWVGRLEKTATSSLLLDTGRCLAGQDELLTLTVSEFDASTGRMLVNMSFMAHNHAALPADATGTEGDTVVGLIGTPIVLDPATLSGTWEPAAATSAQGAYKVEFINENGIWKVRVTSGLAGSNSVFSFATTTFEDVYLLERV